MLALTILRKINSELFTGIFKLRESQILKY